MKIQTITNVEFASICNRACAYCPSQEIYKHRAATFMDDATFNATLDVIQALVRRGTQREVNLFGVGESTLHKNLAAYTARIRTVHPSGHLRLNTNGTFLTAELARDLKSAGITDIHVTDHDAATTIRAMGILEAAGIDHSMNRDFVTGPNNWAGLVDWVPEIDYQLYCAWLGEGQVMVMADGNVTRCCIDAFGTGYIGHIADPDTLEAELTAIDLCDTCHHYRE